MKLNGSVLVLALALILVLPQLVQARSRTGSDLGSRIAALEAAMTTLTADVATLQTDVSTLQTDLATLEGEAVIDSGEDLRMLYGVFQGDGTIVTGSDYSVVRNSTGNYTITFDTAFTSTPSVVFASGGGGQTFNVSSAAITVTNFDNSAMPFDSVIMFTATGPQ